MNDIETMFNLKLESLYGKQIFLYGAKNFGDFAYKLLSYYRVPIAGYVLTNPLSSNTVNGLPVYAIKDLPSIANNEATILLTLDPKYHDEVNPLLKELGFTNVDDTYSKLDVYYYFFYHVYKGIFEQSGVNLSNDVFTYGQYKTLNPYKRKDMASFFYEAGDLVLPAIFNNYDFITEGSYEFGEVSLCEGDIVIDCGANIGLFSSYAASKGCIAYAFEPMGGTILELLMANSNINDQKINIIPYALADEHGEMTINVSPNLGSSSLIIGGDLYGEEKINVTTVDQFVDENKLQCVDFIKSDIEGAERLMLAGAKETLKRFAPKLSICTYHFDDDPQILESIIKDANPNYQIAHKWKKMFAYVPNRP